MTVAVDWSAGPPLPQFVKAGAMGVVGGRVVHAGGMAYPWRESEAVWWLDDDDRWQAGPPLPLGRAYTDGVSVGDGLVVVGGRRTTGAGRLSLADAWWLRPGDEGDEAVGSWRWQRLPDLRQGRAVASLATDGRRLLAVGGGIWERSQGGAFATRQVERCERLDLDDVDAGWQDAGPAPGPTRASAACAVDGTGAYLLGGYECWTEEGERRVRRLRDAWRYDFDTGAWTALADLPFVSSGAIAACPAPGEILLAGGLLRWERDGVEVDHAVHHMRDAGTPRARLVGGYSDLVWRYDVVRDEWSLLPARLPAGVNDHRGALADGRWIVVGGETVDAALSNTTELVAIGTIDITG